MNVYCLLSPALSSVVGVQADFTRKEAEELLDFLDTESRIANHNDLSLPCLLRDQLRATLITDEKLKQDNLS